MTKVGHPEAAGQDERGLLLAFLTLRQLVGALEQIAGPPDRPFLGYDGKLAAKALGRSRVARPKRVRQR
ncbi:MAG: hypothetical protein ACXVVK_23200 [Solirubrobacteraceae bacterium]